MPDHVQELIHGVIKPCVEYFDEIYKFKPDIEDAVNLRQDLIHRMPHLLQMTFDSLTPIIAYQNSNLVDVNQMMEEVQKVRNEIPRQFEKLTQEFDDIIKDRTDKADEMLKHFSLMTAESGISFQADYFAKESQEHLKQSQQWKRKIYWYSVGLGVCVVAGLLDIGYSLIPVTTVSQTIQLTVTKLLLFMILSYLLFLSVRNFMSHTHNAVVNRHRQNALLTFEALVEASQDKDTKDIILTHAASCIFSPQETGYIGTTGNSVGTDRSITEWFSRLMVKLGKQGGP